jgi:hypothetical protein
MLNWVPTKAQRPHRLNRLPGLGRRLCVACEHGGAVDGTSGGMCHLNIITINHNILAFRYRSYEAAHESPSIGVLGWKKKHCAPAHGRTNSRERWSCPRFPDPPSLTARLDSLTASSRSHPSQSLHMTERIFTHGGWIIACGASQLWIAGIAPSFVRRTLVFHRHSRFRSSKLRRCRMRGRSTEGKEGSEIRSEVETAGSSESCGSAAPRVLSYTFVFSFCLEAGLGSATDG